MAFSTDVSINNCQGDLHVHDMVCIIVTHCDGTTWLTCTSNNWQKRWIVFICVMEWRLAALAAPNKLVAKQ